MGTVMNESRRQILLDTPHTETATGAVATFETDMVGRAKEVKVEIEAVQEGSGDPSPENVRPITGWDGVDVQRTGKNLWGKTLINGNVEITNLLKPGETYTASGKIIDTSRQTYLYLCAGENAQITLGYIIVGSREPSFTFTVESGVRYWLYSNASYTNIADVQIELGSTATSYEPYHGSTVPISWSSSAGTVYGGYLEWLRDGTVKLTANTLETVINANSNIVRRDSGAFRTQISAPYTKIRYGGLRAICDRLAVESVSGYDAVQNGKIGMLNNSGDRTSDAIVWRVSDEIATLDQMKEWLNNNPLQLVTYLATPQTYTLTPQEALVFLCGTNNVWNDINDTTVTYWTHKTGGSV